MTTPRPSTLPSVPTGTATGLPVLADERAAALVVEDAARRWAESARGRVAPFVDTHFTLLGSARLHKAALGLDILRAPVNVILSTATAGARASGAAARLVGARRAGAWLSRRTWFLETDVGREILFRVHDELLHLPAEIGDRRVERDALMEAILADPAVRLRLGMVLAALAERADDPQFKTRLTESLATYVGSRTAAAEMAGSLTLAAAGFAAYHQLTPGVVSLAAPLSATLAKSMALSGFWAGPWAGGLWYGMVGAPAASPLLVGTVALSLAAPVAVLTAFAGVVTDPVQRRLGLHRRRLATLVDVIERQVTGDPEAELKVKDFYVARLFDVLDVTAACWRLVSPR